MFRLSGRGKRNIACLLAVGVLFASAPESSIYALSAGEDENIVSVEDGTIDVDIPDVSERELVVTGTIRDEYGAVLPNKRVILEKQLLYHVDNEISEVWARYDEAVTDAEGKYTIPAGKNTVYRISVGDDIPLHSDYVWARDEDFVIDFTVSLFPLQGRVQTESGDAAPDIYITLKRIGGAGSFLGTDDGLFAQDDPVEQSETEEQMVSVLSDENGLFAFGGLPEGSYQVLMGRTGIVMSEFVLDGERFETVIISEDDAKVEEYRNLILADEERATDYGTELDLPGYLLPTPKPTVAPEATVVPNMSAKFLFSGKVKYSNYPYTLKEYAERQHASVSKIDEKKYLDYLDTKKDTTKGMKYLRVDEYRAVSETDFEELYQSMIASYCKAAGLSTSDSSLYGHADVLLKAAKKYDIDPVFLATQTFHESAYGTSRLSRGTEITEVAREGYPRDSHGKFITRKLDKKVKVYNLYGIKAYDADPFVGGSSYAYYNGWTTPEAAIVGAAKYLKENYIHGATEQNTPFKIRFINSSTIWHQYATGPSYAEDLGKRMMAMAGVYSVKAKFTYDLPKYKKAVGNKGKKKKATK